VNLEAPSRWAARLAGHHRERSLATEAGPIRGELLGADALAERARAVARSQRLAPFRRRRRSAPLLTRLDESRDILDRARDRIAAASVQEVDIGPAGEWLLDNYHVVLEHMREVRESLPADYYRELPELSSGPLAGYPRVYELAITFIAHTEGRIELPTVELVTAAFQNRAALDRGAVGGTRDAAAGVAGDVRRMALRTVQRLDEVEAADRWASRIITANEAGGDETGRALREFIAGHPPLTAIFVSRFLRQLRLSDTPFTPLLWLQEYITEEGLSSEEAAARSADRLAVTQVAMARSIESLRVIGHMEWQGFVERCSKLEAVLRADPSGFYAQMTFPTRDQYRHVVERIARRTRRSETEVAGLAVQLAVDGVCGFPDDPAATTSATIWLRMAVPSWSVDLATVPRRVRSCTEAVLRHPNVVFAGGVLAALAAALWLGGSAARAAWPVVLIVALLPAADIAVNVINQLVTLFLPPHALAKLEFRERGVGTEGIPAENRTAVVVPTLFGSVEAVHEALEHLEVQHLANPEAHLHFALLSDFTDSPTEHREGDEAILDAAVRGIRSLNTRYAGRAQDRFYLFHRPREPRQGVWLG
jgi:cyclic beta-1,2-glucan synthetase